MGTKVKNMEELCVIVSIKNFIKKFKTKLNEINLSDPIKYDETQRSLIAILSFMRYTNPFIKTVVVYRWNHTL